LNFRALDLLACPSCGNALTWDGGSLRCPTDGVSFPDHPSGLPDLRPPAARAAAEAFAETYREARLAEGWRPLTAEAARVLPLGNPPGFTRLYWAVRRESWTALPGLLRDLGAAPLLLADLGAGFPWLSHRLATSGHRVLAVDLSADPDFGLGASRLYPTARSGDESPYRERLEARHFWPVLGDLEHPPLGAGVYDAVICNASLHYARHLPAAVRRMAGALRPGGVLIVLDSPCANTPRVGDRPGSRILGRAEVADALEAAGLSTTWIAVRRGWRWAAHRLGVRLQQRRAFDFPIVVAKSEP
jgi:SAM-dependent methyltransferase